MDEINLKLCPAIVINTEDENSLGRIQVRILPNMVDIEDEFLPWYMPFNAHSIFHSRKTPFKEEDMIWVLSNKGDITQGFYLESTFPLADKFDFTAIEDIIGELEEAGEENPYNHLHFNLYPDGSLSYRNTETGERFDIHNNGSYSGVTEDGLHVINSATTKVTLADDGLLTATFDESTYTIQPDGSLEAVIGDATITIPVDGNGSLVFKELMIDADKIIFNGAGTGFVRYDELIKIIEKFEAHAHMCPTGMTAGDALNPDMSPIGATIIADKNAMESEKVLGE